MAELRAILRHCVDQHKAAMGLSTADLRAACQRHSMAAEHAGALAAQQAVVGGLLRAGGRAAVRPEDWSRLVTLLNSYALDLFGHGRRILLLGEAPRGGDAAMAAAQLRTAEVLCLSERLLPDAPVRCSLASLTATNFSCLHRDAGRIFTALRYSLAALKHDERGGLDPAVSHLNCCATLSQLGRHEEALRHAQMSCTVGDLRPRTSAVRAAAYFNLGAQQMTLGMLGQAADSFRKAIRMHPRSTTPTSNENAGLVASEAGMQPEWTSLDEMERRLDDCERMLHDEKLFGRMQASLPIIRPSFGRTNAVSRSKSVDLISPSEDLSDPAARPVSLPQLESKVQPWTQAQTRTPTQPEQAVRSEEAQVPQKLASNHVNFDDQKLYRKTPREGHNMDASQAHGVLTKPQSVSASDRQQHQEAGPPKQKRKQQASPQHPWRQERGEQVARHAESKYIEMEQMLHRKDQHIQAMGIEMKLASKSFDESMMQLDKVQRDLFTALEQEKKKRVAAEQEVDRLKTSLALIAHNQHQVTRFTVGLAAGWSSYTAGGGQPVKHMSIEP